MTILKFRDCSRFSMTVRTVKEILRGHCGVVPRLSVYLSVLEKKKHAAGSDGDFHRGVCKASG